MVAMGRKLIWMGSFVVVLLIVFLAVAWSNGGRKPQHVMVQPVAVPGAVQ